MNMFACDIHPKLLLGQPQFVRCMDTIQLPNSLLFCASAYFADTESIKSAKIILKFIIKMQSVASSNWAQQRLLANLYSNFILSQCLSVSQLIGFQKEDIFRLILW